ncbi:hypothetical protein D043_2284A, partial [Vibrio parahaemolyticus EKP-021]
MFAAFV